MPTGNRVESIPLQRQRVDVSVLLELTTEVMQRQARALGVSLDITIGDDVPDVVSIDRDKVGWVITSLVGSALRHVRSPGGSIEVAVAYDRAQSTLSITVRDDGPGMPPDQLDKLLTRRGWRPGAALALLLVEDVAVAHGGSIQVESRTDRAHHFTLVRFTVAAPAAT